MTPNEYCENKVRQSGSSLYYSILFLSEQQRTAIIPLFAFFREVKDIVDECHEAQVAQSKLQWWTEEIYITFNADQQHKPSHPVCLALQPLLEKSALKMEYFLDIIHGMEMDLHHRGFQSFTELEKYCYHTNGAMNLLTIEIMGYQDPKTHRYAKALGTALQLTHILREIKTDIERSHLYIPQDELQRFGVTLEMLQSGEDTSQLRQLFAFQAERAESYFQKALDILPETDRYQQRTGLIMTSIDRAILKKIKKQHFPVLNRRVTINPLYKLWLAWNTAGKEYRRSLSNK